MKDLRVIFDISQSPFLLRKKKKKKMWKETIHIGIANSDT